MSRGALRAVSTFASIERTVWNLLSVRNRRGSRYCTQYTFDDVIYRHYPGCAAMAFGGFCSVITLTQKRMRSSEMMFASAKTNSLCLMFADLSHWLFCL